MPFLYLPVSEETHLKFAQGFLSVVIPHCLHCEILCGIVDYFAALGSRDYIFNSLVALNPKS